MSGTIKISIRGEVAKMRSQLDGLARKQLPFATARAVNQLARLVRDGERQNMKEVFKNPRPFTVNSTQIVKGATATKLNPSATVAVRPEAEKYLEPYEVGGSHYLPGGKLNNPKAISLDQYGQIRKGQLKTLFGRANIFAGTIIDKGTPITGFWMRTKGADGKGAGLKLLVRVGTALPVHKRLGFEKRARAIVQTNAGPLLNAAIAKAIASAKR